MAKNDTHLVFGVCPVCKEETTREISDEDYDRYDRLLRADDADIEDYRAAFNGDPALAAFLYAGFCENHANI